MIEYEYIGCMSRLIALPCVRTSPPLGDRRLRPANYCSRKASKAFSKACGHSTCGSCPQ